VIRISWRSSRHRPWPTAASTSLLGLQHLGSSLTISLGLATQRLIRTSHGEKRIRRRVGCFSRVLALSGRLPGRQRSRFTLYFVMRVRQLLYPTMPKHTVFAKCCLYFGPYLDFTFCFSQLFTPSHFCILVSGVNRSFSFFFLFSPVPRLAPARFPSFLFTLLFSSPNRIDWTQPAWQPLSSLLLSWGSPGADLLRSFSFA